MTSDSEICQTLLDAQRRHARAESAANNSVIGKAGADGTAGLHGVAQAIILLL